MRWKTSSRDALRLAGWVLPICLILVAFSGLGAESPAGTSRPFPPPLESYDDSEVAELWKVLQGRIRQQPLNLWVTLLFLGAIVHTFFTHQFLHWSHVLDKRHKARARAANGGEEPETGSVGARLLHFMGEVEAVFGIWCIPLLLLLAARLNWSSSVNYFSNKVSYIEPIFVVVIMAMSATRPILRLAEKLMGFFARLGGGTPAAWWMAALTVGPLLGSLITEPAAMTISALLLAKRLFEFKPSARLAYATLGLLFVNVSVGGALTHFAAPPVLMVAAHWGWTTAFMFRHFGWVAIVGIVLSNGLYYLALRKEFAKLELVPPPAESSGGQAPVPVWITVSHLAFMAWTVVNAHYPVLLVGGFLFFLAFHEATQEHQNDVQLRSALLVGFFLAGLVVHGGLQQWWIGPTLSRLKEIPLMLGATALTAFNDNAAITYLGTLEPSLTDSMKYVLVAGALAGGGLTVIANAPNPAGQAILGRYFRDGVAPLALLLGALPATIIMILCFLGAR